MAARIVHDSVCRWKLAAIVKSVGKFRSSLLELNSHKARIIHLTVFIIRSTHSVYVKQVSNKYQDILLFILVVMCLLPDLLYESNWHPTFLSPLPPPNCHFTETQRPRCSGTASSRWDGTKLE